MKLKDENVTYATDFLIRFSYNIDNVKCLSLKGDYSEGKRGRYIFDY